MSIQVPNPMTEDEWKECRATIGRFDSILADLRKYGFSLVTLLLTATALITNNAATAAVSASSVVVALLVVLFIMDRYWWVLLIQTVSRAEYLEDQLGMQISGRLSKMARSSFNELAATVVYALFVAVAAAVAVIRAVNDKSDVALHAMLEVFGGAIVIIVGLHFWFQWRLHKAQTP